ncbi:winged helix-turn-helix transcriptional regulator [Sphingomonas sp. 2R-10]|uniref:winged helix-turn-helix transcriptional regulator n=1 Tax=Sphingomonas sp. 2R-10 TaxID=3045148 RepID=UPI000F78C780|nr:winged helix-turn-helix transcriptional regulator [Sphingomonas sp. 2R-10]MDJ0278570.1 winged helix-turn-helix transcriptional regulator [Sphingomonas sp. 2R-10]
MELEKVTKEAKRRYDDACGAALGMEYVGERWALLLIRELLLGPRRFGEIRAGLPGISANVLTQRLAGLEAAGIVGRHRLPSPANAQVYALTPWGREAEPVVLALAKWALRSPAHDPTLPFSAVSLMLSLKMLLVTERAGDWRACVAFRFGDDRYVATLADGAVQVRRGAGEDVDATLSGSPGAFLPVVYGGRPLAMAETIAVEGNRAIAERFTTLFRLPPKVE